MELKALPKPLQLILLTPLVLLKLHKKHTRALKRTLSNTHGSSFKSQTLISQIDNHHDDLSQKTLIFDVEETLLRSSSVFPYFMLVAFESGSLIRAFLLFALWPLLFLVNDELSIKIMVMVSFFGIKKEGFRVGSSVLPKFFLEDVGMEGFDLLVRNGKKTVGVSKLPRVMVECFLKDYLKIDHVFGRELTVFGGYFVGLMKENKSINEHRINKVLEQDDEAVCLSNKSVKRDWVSCSKGYLVSNEEKKVWQNLPREKYPKDLIFHDGRLAFRPEPLRMLVMFMWFPFAVLLLIFRTVIALTMPYGALIPILSFTGMQLMLTNNNSTQDASTSHNHKQHKGRLYVCNHRTLLDPLYLSFGLKKPFAAVTYSLSRMSEILSPIKTVRLTRDRDQDAKTMDKMLKLGDLVVCPEGTTCREPYLLRFSPLFAELSDHIVPVALDSYVTMFYGTTAGGLKCLDPFFFMMNPNPVYSVQFLDQIHGVSSHACGTKSTRFDVANYVQSEIGKTLDFECTSLTRKDKYLVLAGNEGFVNSKNTKK